MCGEREGRKGELERETDRQTQADWQTDRKETECEKYTREIQIKTRSRL